MERSDVLTRPLREVLREADHEDLELQRDPGGRAQLERWMRKTVPPFDSPITDAAVQRMRGAWRNDTLLDEGGDALFETRAGVGDRETNSRVDVAKVETLLDATGDLDLKSLNGPTGFFAAGKGAAIRDFQGANGLNLYGQILPNGPTIRALQAAVHRKPPRYLAAAPTSATTPPPTDDGSRHLSGVQFARVRPDSRTLEEEAVEAEGYSADRRAFFERTGVWADDEAWGEIKHGLANPGAVINPRMEAARMWAIRNNRKAVFDIKDNPKANDDPAPHRDHARGFAAVASYNAIIAREAKRQGVDPDLVRAIMYVENADGDPRGLNKALESVGWAKTLLPMNINDRIWAGIGGVNRSEFKDPEQNIRACVALIKAISDRLRPADRTPGKIGTIWNHTGRENVNDIGARIQRTYDERSWRIILDHRR